MSAMTIVQPQTNAEIYRASTDAAGLCREIVLKTAMEIQQRKYVKVEGWQAIAIAHGCTGSARDVERIEGGVKAIGEVRRMSDGALIAQAEGFVGEDEATWFGGVQRAWKWGAKKGEKIWYDKTLEKRPDYAIRAMAQTRAISRACRSAFAHVVVLIDSNLSTTPAEEVPLGDFDNGAVIEADAPREKPLWITAAKTGIDLCMTPDDCKAWKAQNGAMVKSQPSDEADEVIRYFNERVAAVKEPEPKAEAAFRPDDSSSVSGSGAGEVTPFDAPDSPLGDDEIPY